MSRAYKVILLKEKEAILKYISDLISSIGSIFQWLTTRTDKKFCRSIE
jgi:hypothetical protein